MQTEQDQTQQQWVEGLAEMRFARGLEQAHRTTIKRVKDGKRDGWLVPSETKRGRHYFVGLDTNPDHGQPRLMCECDDYAEYGEVYDEEGTWLKCKHIVQVELQTKQIPLGVPLDERVKRPRYQPENARATTQARENERPLMHKLLRDLGNLLPHVVANGPGRPPIRLGDMLFAFGMKLYEKESWDNMKSLYKQYWQQGLIEHIPGRTTIATHLADPQLTPLLQSLVGVTSAPLIHLEGGEIAVDGTGISLRTYAPGYRQHRYGTPRPRQHGYLRLHVAGGPYTKVMAAGLVTQSFDEGTGESPQLRPLIESIRKRTFQAGFVFADKAYSSYENIQYIFDVGGFPVVPFREKTGRNDSAPESWNLLDDVYRAQRPWFLRKYGRRQNIEATFSSFKRTVGSSVRCRTFDGQVNEILMMASVYNIKRVINFIFVLGLQPMFQLSVAA